VVRAVAVTACASLALGFVRAVDITSVGNRDRLVTPAAVVNERRPAAE
jgi:hypothetical protein